MASKELDILVVTYQSADCIAACIDSLRRHVPHGRIQVVDNHSSDGSAELAQGLGLDVRANSENRKLSAVWNEFLKESAAPFVMFVNPDVVLHDGSFVGSGMKMLAENAQIAAVGRMKRITLGKLFAWEPPVCPDDREVFVQKAKSSEWFRHKQIEERDAEDEPFDYIDGCCMIVSRERILRVGGFDEQLPLYFNDSELTLRIYAAGLRLAEVWREGDGQLHHSLYGSSRPAGAAADPIHPASLNRLRERVLHPVHTLRNGAKRLDRWLGGQMKSRRAESNGDQRLFDRYRLAMGWITDHTDHNGGVWVSNRNSRPYPEVTGYLIPTLRRWGERELALQYGRWLASIQNADGSWSDPDGRSPYTFDTGQILKGLLALIDWEPALETSLRRGCDWLCQRIQADGRITTPDATQWGLPGGRVVPEAIHVYTLEPLREAGRRWSEPRYGEAVQRALDYYLADPALTEPDTLTHFHAYIVEALVDLGQTARARDAMERVRDRQLRDGAIGAYRDARWICSTGLFQYALVWYKLGERELADRAFRRAAALQNPSGGFFGGYGRGATYFPQDEIAWAVKYFLDALTWRIRASFNDEVGIFPDEIDPNDGRYRIIADEVRAQNARKVLDVGCGKGRFLHRLSGELPGLELSGLDVSERMLAGLGPAIQPIRGSLLDIPSPNDSFDLVYSVETLEHAVNVQAAIREMVRVVRPGGTLVIIDKNRERQGQLQISDWEQWFSVDEVRARLEALGLVVDVRRGIPYSSNSGSDNLFIAWIARKPSECE